MRRTIVTIVVIAAATLLASGCGGTPEISTVSGCLEELGLNVEPSGADEPLVEEGVFAVTDLAAPTEDPAAATSELTFGLAAVAVDDEAVTKFRDKAKEFGETTAKGGDVEFESGTDGRYVWVAGGAKGSEAFEDVRDCVRP